MEDKRNTACLPISSSELQKRVIDHDSALIGQGRPPHQRALAVSMAIARELGITWTLGGRGSDPVTDAVHAIYRQIYRTRDLALPPIHVGAFMFRDVFFRIWVPVGYGKCRLDPFQLIDDMSDIQKRWMASEPNEVGRFHDQFVDLFDFGYGLDDFSKVRSDATEALNLLSLSRAHLEAAANACVGSIDPYAIAQNSLIAVELILKGALRAAGYGEKELKDIGHNMATLSAAFLTAHPQADGARVERVCVSLPRLVTHRYERLALTRQEVGHIVMKSQYIAGEVMRQLSDRDIRQALCMGGTSAPRPRVFPT